MALEPGTPLATTPAMTPDDELASLFVLAAVAAALAERDREFRLVLRDLAVPEAARN